MEEIFCRNVWKTGNRIQPERQQQIVSVPGRLYPAVPEGLLSPGAVFSRTVVLAQLGNIVIELGRNIP